MGIARAGLVALWVGIIALLTHCPTDSAILAAMPGLPHSDKPVHFGLYFVLGWLVWYRRSAQAIELVSVALLAAADEATQPWLGRTADFADWCADMLGVTAALGMLRLVFSKPHQTSRDTQLQQYGPPR